MGTYQMVAFVGFLELFVMKEDAYGGPGSAFVGDFRNGAIDFGWDKLSPEAQTKKRAIELNNGTSERETDRAQYSLHHAAMPCPALRWLPTNR